MTTAYQYDETGNLLQVMDVSSDVNNCGGIGSVCAVPSNGYATCTDGTCGSSCNLAQVVVLADHLWVPAPGSGNEARRRWPCR